MSVLLGRRGGAKGERGVDGGRTAATGDVCRSKGADEWTTCYFTLLYIWLRHPSQKLRHVPCRLIRGTRTLEYQQPVASNAPCNVLAPQVTRAAACGIRSGNWISRREMFLKIKCLNLRT
jgi:hypothetical protein